MASLQEVAAVALPGRDARQMAESVVGDYLLPLLDEFGAESYGLLTGDAPTAGHESAAARFVEAFAESEREGARSLVDALLGSERQEVRAFVLRRLNCALLAHMAGVRASALKSIAGAIRRTPTFSVFLDTNLLFTMLGLQDTESGSGARRLLELPKAIAPAVTLDFYVLPNTLEEARTSLRQKKRYCETLRSTANIRDAALRTQLSGVVRAYFAKCQDAGGFIPPDDYFDPYIDQLQVILRDKGIKYYNDSEAVARAESDQRVIDDIHALREHYEARHKDKPWEVLQHDVVLWTIVAGKRSPSVESAAGARYWVATFDSGLLGYDAARARDRKHSVPLCLRPAALIQLLRFWCPSESSLDAAFVESLRLPMVFPQFSEATEEVTCRIAETLARYSNRSELSAEAALEVLTDRTLRSKMAKTESRERDLELVEEAFIRSNSSLRTQANEERRRAADAESRAEAAEAANVTLSGWIERFVADSRAEEYARLCAKLRRSLALAAVLYSLPLLAWICGYIWLRMTREDEIRPSKELVVMGGVALALLLILLDYLVAARARRWREWKLRRVGRGGLVIVATGLFVEMLGRLA